jgi:hypothetical protein
MLASAICFNKFQYNIKWLLTIGCFFCVLGPFIATFATSFKAANLIYVVVFGIGSGFNIMLSLQCLWEYYYRSKTYITGFI